MMTLTKAAPRSRSIFAAKDSKGWVLYGNRPDTGKWLERWYATKDAAIAFCIRKGWPIKEAAA